MDFDVMKINSPSIHGCSSSSDCSVSDRIKVNYAFLLENFTI